MNKSIGYITGEEFMELAAVQGAKVLSAPKSLHRRIGKVNILEVPDIEKYVEEDDQQALLIKRIAGLCNLKRAVIRYRDLGSYTVLSLLPMEHPEILRMEERFVKPIREYDTAHNTKLLETLSTYFGTEQNLRETAACMYTHYNTISYRMEKIRELLALPKWDAEIQLQLQIALKLWNMNFKDRNEAAR